jgi:hypothetical protein
MTWVGEVTLKSCGARLRKPPGVKSIGPSKPRVNGRITVCSGLHLLPFDAVANETEVRAAERPQGEQTKIAERHSRVQVDCRLFTVNVTLPFMCHGAADAAQGAGRFVGRLDISRRVIRRPKMPITSSPTN